MSHRRLALLAAVLVLGAATAASAQPTQAQQNAIRQSCRSDYMSHCSSVPTGGRAALQCLQQHVGDVSPACQAALAPTMPGAGAPAAAAPAPVQAPAPAPATAPSSAAAKPLPELSMREEAMLMRRSCGADFRSYCGDVAMGGGRGLACLAENEERLSPQCRTAIGEIRNR